MTELNRALETSALATLLAFLIVDISATCAILGTLIAFRVRVPADFALALALSKSLRGVRLALDASLAALLTRWLPCLNAVKVSLCFDEGAEAWEALAALGVYHAQRRHSMRLAQLMQRSL